MRQLCVCQKRRHGYDVEKIGGQEVLRIAMKCTEVEDCSLDE